jgi:hypothetical protein
MSIFMIIQAIAFKKIAGLILYAPYIMSIYGSIFVTEGYIAKKEFEYTVPVTYAFFNFN